MASDLYEVLGISKDATPEQIRKAYRRKALETHPDRLPLGSTPDDKAIAEERFRKVNNAYEVLNSTQTRNLYDLHGIWPPPEATRPEPSSGPQHTHSHQHQFNHRHHHMPRTYNVFQHHDPFAFVFTDPFVLFDSIFGDFGTGGPMHVSSHQRAFPMAHNGIFQGISRMQAELDGLMSSIEDDTRTNPYERVHQRTNKPRFVQSYSTTSFINGRMESMEHKIDSEGNQHARRVHPDGRETYTINGVEQLQHGSRGYISGGPCAVVPSQRSVRIGDAPSSPYTGSPHNYGRAVPVVLPHGRQHDRIHPPSHQRRQAVPYHSQSINCPLAYATHSDPAPHHGRYESRSRRRPYDYY